ncbi:hypothetical protein F8388_008548 [Cannabis sativa]|uniref:RNase H type-1 domain-containing protein n=1 Tax=Cannabis sativa TaxID=3483 RepID=A0A7J6I0R4_CANSA|nr:hypothetical protein F8388_008548 [Cannabis sativa]KAF4400578.1 hypothetical protein G4B88_023371 [Cannabis sativa]
MELELSTPVFTTSHPTQSFDPFSQPSNVHQFSQSAIPPPIMVTSVITQINKGKGISMLDPSPPPPIVNNPTRNKTLEHTNCVTGLGFVIKRGSNQVLASASIQKPSAPTSIFAEGQALLEGLSWCLSLQMQPNFIITDCLNLVTKVNGQWQDNSALSSLVSKIRQSFSNFPATSLHHLS